MMNNPIVIGNKKIDNRVVLQPMEGCDCNTDGSPSELTFEKYMKAAQSGAGTVWFEANAVCPEGRTDDIDGYIRYKSPCIEALYAEISCGRGQSIDTK